MADEIENQSRRRRQHLEKLIKDFERDQTIQDVGTWLLKDSSDPLPPKHVAVLRKWLETHNELTIKQSLADSLHFETFNTDESLDASWNDLFGVDPPTRSGSFVTLRSDSQVTWKAGWLEMGGMMELEIKSDEKSGLKKITIKSGGSRPTSASPPTTISCRN